MDDPNQISLHDVLHNSYSQDPNALTKNGFNYDQELSNHNQQVYYNPKQNKLLYSIAGTHNLNDIGTDIYLGLGKIKDTNRYKSADDTLTKAKQKYQPANTVVVGHSLGGNIASKIGKPEDKIITYNKGSTINEKVIPQEKSYRSNGDLVSIFNSTNNNTTTLKNKKYLLPVLPTFSSLAKNGYKRHLTNNLKNENIFI